MDFISIILRIIIGICYFLILFPIAIFIIFLLKGMFSNVLLKKRITEKKDGYTLIVEKNRFNKKIVSLNFIADKNQDFKKIVDKALELFSRGNKKKNYEVYYSDMEDHIDVSETCKIDKILSYIIAMNRRKGKQYIDLFSVFYEDSYPSSDSDHLEICPPSYDVCIYGSNGFLESIYGRL